MLQCMCANTATVVRYTIDDATSATHYASLTVLIVEDIMMHGHMKSEVIRSDSHWHMK